MITDIEQRTSIIFVGHFAIDQIIRYKHKNKPCLGGSVCYCSLALSNYTKSANISIISNIGKANFKHSLLDNIKKRKIDLQGVLYSEGKNTNFVIDYYDHNRTLTLKARSPNLEFNNIPQNYLDFSPDVFVLVPLCNEISYDYVFQIRKQFPDVHIGIDLQGFIRKYDEYNNILYVYDEEVVANIKNIINLIGDKLILKGSEEEMKILAKETNDLNEVMNHFKRYNPEALFIMTLGENGSMILNKSKVLHIPAFKPKRTLDETGAGDVYISIFLYEFIRSDKSLESIKNSAYLASAAASFLVEKKGPSGFKKLKKILKRIKKNQLIDQSGC